MVSVHRLIKKVKRTGTTTTGTTERKTGNGRLRTAATDENKQYVEEMIASQEECPGTRDVKAEAGSRNGGSGSFSAEGKRENSIASAST